jgi:hypothetical protein
MRSEMLFLRKQMVKKCTVVQLMFQYAANLSSSSLESSTISANLVSPRDLKIISEVFCKH